MIYKEQYSHFICFMMRRYTFFFKFQNFVEKRHFSYYLFVHLRKLFSMNKISYPRKRLITFDAIRCLAIFLVIWGHCIGDLSSCNVADHSIYRIIYSFHMPLFMMISGYFANSSMGMPFFFFIKKKFRQLIYPCLTVGCIIWLYLEVTNSFSYHRDYVSIIALIEDFYWFSDFWFLKCCFICYFLTYLGIKSRIKEKYWIVITLLFSQCVAPFFVSFMYPCFLLGMKLHDNDTLKQRIIHYQWVIIFTFVIMLCFYSSDMWNNSHGIPKGIIYAEYSVWIKIALSRFFRLLIGIIGALSFYTIFIQVFNSTRQSKLTNLLADWGKYTLEVYILQAVLLEKVIATYLQLDYIAPFVYNFVVTPLLAFVILFILIILTKTFYKIPKLGVILFGRTI